MTDFITIADCEYRVDYDLEADSPEEPGGVLVGVVWDENGELVHDVDLIDEITEVMMARELQRSEE